jgi:hypothetical protein
MGFIVTFFDTFIHVYNTCPAPHYPFLSLVSVVYLDLDSFGYILFVVFLRSLYIDFLSSFTNLHSHQL